MEQVTESEEIVIEKEESAPLLATSASRSYRCKFNGKTITQGLVIGIGSSMGLGGAIYLLLEKEPLLALAPLALFIFSLIVAGIIQYCPKKEPEVQSALAMRSLV